MLAEVSTPAGPRAGLGGTFGRPGSMILRATLGDDHETKRDPFGGGGGAGGRRGVRVRGGPDDQAVGDAAVEAGEQVLRGRGGGPRGRSEGDRELQGEDGRVL